MTKQDQVDLLLVEGAADYAEFVIEAFKKSNYFDYHIVWVRNLADARFELEHQEYDIVIFNLVLPNGEGTDLVKEIRRLAPRKRTAIIVIGSSITEESELEVRRELANDYLCKDEVTAKDLLTTVRNWAIFALGVKEARRATSGLDTIGQQMDETIQACERSENLPPFKGQS